MKLWVKLLKGDKLYKDTVYEGDFSLHGKSYIAALQDICYILDIAAPITLSTHTKHLERFNRVKYLPRDFVEEVDFDAFIIENVVETKKDARF